MKNLCQIGSSQKELLYNPTESKYFEEEGAV
jgi:hypothetical protein